MTLSASAVSKKRLDKITPNPIKRKKMMMIITTIKEATTAKILLRFLPSFVMGVSDINFSWP
ncbi:MAG: hypothetical protein WCC17_15155 [Candidatus Nitrosopolaris sp.]